jgi:RNase H-fold protein (predicted Holliday junction resolvase)
VLQFRPGVLCGGKLTQKEVEERASACTAQQLKLLRASREFKLWESPVSSAKQQRIIAGISIFFVSILFLTTTSSSRYLQSKSSQNFAAAPLETKAAISVDPLGSQEGTLLENQLQAQVEAQVQEYDRLKFEYDTLLDRERKAIQQKQDLAATLADLQKKSRIESNEYTSTIASLKEDVRQLVMEKQSLLDASLLKIVEEQTNNLSISTDEEMLRDISGASANNIKRILNDVLLASEATLVLLTVFYLYANLRLQKAVEKSRKQYIVAYQRQQAILARAEDAYRDIAATKAMAGTENDKKKEQNDEWVKSARAILNNLTETLGDSVAKWEMESSLMSPDTFIRHANEKLGNLRTALDAVKSRVKELEMEHEILLSKIKQASSIEESLEAQIEQLTLSLVDESSQKHKAESRVASLEADLSSLHIVAESLRDQLEHLQEWARANSLTSPLSSPALVKQLGSPLKRYPTDSPVGLEPQIRARTPSHLWTQQTQSQVQLSNSRTTAMLSAQLDQIAELLDNGEESDHSSEGGLDGSNGKVLDKLARAANKFSVAEQYLSQQIPKDLFRDMNNENDIQLLNRNFVVDVPIKMDRHADEEEERTRRFVATVEESVHQVENSLLAVVVTDEAARKSLINAKEAVETSLSTVLMAQAKAKRARHEYDAAARLALHRQREMEEARKAMEAAVLDQSDQSNVRQAAKKLVSAERAQQEASENVDAAKNSLHHALKTQLSAKDELRSLQQRLLTLVESLYSFQNENSGLKSENRIKEAESVSPKLPLSADEDVFDAVNAADQV